MVDDEIRRSAEDLSEVAEKLKLLARRTRSTEVRDDLLALAERFQRMVRCMSGEVKSRK
jgi:hypothetical protein